MRSKSVNRAQLKFQKLIEERNQKQRKKYQSRKIKLKKVKEMNRMKYLILRFKKSRTGLPCYNRTLRILTIQDIFLTIKNA